MIVRSRFRSSTPISGWNSRTIASSQRFSKAEGSLAAIEGGAMKPVAPGPHPASRLPPMAEGWGA